MLPIRINAYPLVVILLLAGACSQGDPRSMKEEPVTGWEYLGQPLPGSSPVLFYPGVISTHRNERDFTISPNGRIIFYSYALPGFARSAIITTHFDGQVWTDPEIASFSGNHNDLEPAFSPDGNSLFFISKRPVSIADSASDWNVWHTIRQDGKWKSAQLADIVSSDGNEFYPSVAANGNLYMTIEGHPASLGGEDIYYCPLRDGKYDDPINLGAGVNSPGPEFNAFISPDEKFLLYSSFGREDGLGGGDLYISYRNDSGIWQSARNLGPVINSAYLDYCPFVTPDGRFLFFTSQRLNPTTEDPPQLDIEGMKTLEDQTGNGNGDIYWIEFDQLAWK